MRLSKGMLMRAAVSWALAVIVQFAVYFLLAGNDQSTIRWDFLGMYSIVFWVVFITGPDWKMLKRRPEYFALLLMIVFAVFSFVFVRT